MSERAGNPRTGRKLCDCCTCPTTRYFVTFMLFLGMANSYIMRTNMSVAIVAMVNHTAIATPQEFSSHDCPKWNLTQKEQKQDGEFVWNTKVQGYILSSFFYGYVVTQIPCGLLAKKYGALNFLGWGMLLNSIFSFFVPIAAKKIGAIGLCVVRFLQGVCEGPIVPCSHALLAKWTPPNERSRMCATVYAGAQFGTVFSLPISGILAEHNFGGGWPLIFYVFGFVSLVWSISFLSWVYEDPRYHPSISESERTLIVQSIWGEEEDNKKEKKAIPFGPIFKSLPFYAILCAHMGQNYGYETLITELPTYLKQILHFSLKENGVYSSIPFMAMWLFSILSSLFADRLISTQRLSITATRRIMNTIGQCGPSLALMSVSFTGCNRILSVAILTIGVGLNGAIFSGFKVNHMDLSPRFAGFMMAVTNCLANIFGLTAPIIAGHIIYENHTIGRWRVVFFISAGIYIVGALFFNFFAAGNKQWWDNPLNTSKPIEERTEKSK